MAARPARHGPRDRFGGRAASRPVVLAATLLYLVMLTLAIRAAQAPPVNLTGTWLGTASDFWVNRGAVDGMNVRWTLTQTDSTVSGTVTSTPLNATDGSCSSCHRAKRGTVSGTVSGTALALTMDFPGQSDESTPECSVSFSGAAATVATPSFTTLYTLEDSCEGSFVNGVLTMTREGYQLFTDDPLSPGVSVVRVVHIAELRSRINVVRGRLSLSSYSFAEPAIAAGGTSIRAQHVRDLRTALSEAYVVAGRTPPTYTDPDLAPGGLIRAVHIAELRAALTAIE